MFNENFSFFSSSSTTYTSQPHDSISPFTSRPSSPRPQYHTFSQYPPRRDSRFDSHRTRNPSITALTAHFQNQNITHNQSIPTSTPNATSPSDQGSSSETEADEGFFDGPDTPSSVSDYSDFDPSPSLFNLSMTDLNTTSSPRPSLSLEAQALSSHTMRRRQRQALVRLQCLAKRAPDLAMLLEECHPSSMPLAPEPVWAGPSRSGSTTSLSGRIEKASGASASVRKPPRMRKRERSSRS